MINPFTSNEDIHLMMGNGPEYISTQSDALSNLGESSTPSTERMYAFDRLT